MSELTQPFLDETKTKLTEEKKRLESELGYFEKPVGDEYQTKYPDYGEKEDENAQEVATFVTRLSVGNTLEKELRDVNQALQLMARGAYGMCKYCKQPIDERRLRARPTSTSCVSCKQKLKGDS